MEEDKYTIQDVKDITETQKFCEICVTIEEIHSSYLAMTDAIKKNNRERILEILCDIKNTSAYLAKEINIFGENYGRNKRYCCKK